MAAIVIANQKGGCGKTTTVFNLSGALASLGCQTLLIDLDPQGNLSASFDLRDTPAHILDVYGDPSCRPAKTNIPHIDIITSDKKTSSLIPELVSTPQKTWFLYTYLQAQKSYGCILIDTPPTLGSLLSAGALAADYYLIPMNTGYYTLQGTRDLMSAMTKIRSKLKPSLRFLGACITMHTRRTSLAREILREIKNFYRQDLLSPEIPQAVRIEESQIKQTPMPQYRPKDPISEAYVSLSQNIIARTKANG